MVNRSSCIDVLYDIERLFRSKGDKTVITVAVAEIELLSRAENREILENYSNQESDRCEKLGYVCQVNFWTIELWGAIAEAVWASQV